MSCKEQVFFSRNACRVRSILSPQNHETCLNDIFRKQTASSQRLNATSKQETMEVVEPVIQWAQMPSCLRKSPQYSSQKRLFSILSSATNSKIVNKHKGKLIKLEKKAIEGQPMKKKIPTQPAQICMKNPTLYEPKQRNSS